jgi:hypothetical protein
VVRRVASGFDTSTPRDEASSFLNPNTSSTLPFAPEAAVGSTININPLIEIYISSASGTSAASAPVQCVCLEVNDTLLEPRKKEIYHSTLRSSSVSYFERTTVERELLFQDTTPAHTVCISPTSCPVQSLHRSTCLSPQRNQPSERTCWSVSKLWRPTSPPTSSSSASPVSQRKTSIIRPKVQPSR